MVKDSFIDWFQGCCGELSQGMITRQKIHQFISLPVLRPYDNAWHRTVSSTYAQKPICSSKETNKETGKKRTIKFTWKFLDLYKTGW